MLNSTWLRGSNDREYIQDNRELSEEAISDR